MPDENAPDQLGVLIDEWVGQLTEDSNLGSDLRLKMRYQFVLGRLDGKCDNRPAWEDKRREIEDKLMDADIRPSSLIT